MRYRANELDCQACSLKPQCCPTAPARQDPAVHSRRGRSRRERDDVSPLPAFLHLLAHEPLLPWRKLIRRRTRTQWIEGQTMFERRERPAATVLASA